MTALRILSRWLVPLCAGAAVAVTALGEARAALAIGLIGGVALLLGAWGWPFRRVDAWGPASRSAATIFLLGGWATVVYFAFARAFGRSGWSDLIGAIIAFWFVMAVIERWAWFSMDSDGGTTRR